MALFIKPMKNVDNPARRKPVNAEQARNIANNQNLQSVLNADFNQLLLRISDAPTGLRFGTPPGGVL